MLLQTTTIHCHLESIKKVSTYDDIYFFTFTLTIKRSLQNSLGIRIFILGPTTMLNEIQNIVIV